MSRIRKSGVALLLAFALLAAGCTTKTPPPPPNTGGDKPPVPVVEVGPPKNLGDGCKAPPLAEGRPTGNLRPGILVQEGICEAAAPLEAFYVNFQLPGTVDEAAARSAVHVEGATPERVDVFMGNGANLYVYLPAGQKGDRLTVRIAGPLGTGGAPVDLGFHLWRTEPPHMTAEIKPAGADWQPVNPGATLPAGPLSLRFHLFGKLDREQVATQLREVFAPGKDDPAPIPLEVTTQGEDLVLATLPSPPARVQVYLSGGRGEYSLDANALYFTVYVGEPPRLVSYDPATGRESALGEAPVDIWDEHPAPDFKWTLFAAIPGDNQAERGVYLLDTQAGTTHKTSLTAAWGSALYLWGGGKLVVPAATVQTLDLATRAVTTAPTAAELWTNAAPNQRYLAGFNQHTAREDNQTWLAPTDVVIHDLQTHKETVLKDFIHTSVHHSESPPIMTARWSDDSKTLYVGDEQRTSAQVSPTLRWLAIDVATGKVSDAAAPPVKNGPGPHADPGPTGWTWEQTQPWGTILLRAPDGKSREAGQGRVLGWRPDGQLLIVRWANGRYARSPGI